MFCKLSVILTYVYMYMFVFVSGWFNIFCVPTLPWGSLSSSDIWLWRCTANSVVSVLVIPWKWRQRSLPATAVFQQQVRHPRLSTPNLLTLLWHLLHWSTSCFVSRRDYVLFLRMFIVYFIACTKNEGYLVHCNAGTGWLNIAFYYSFFGGCM